MQIKSNITPELAAAFNCWKDNHESSDNEAEPDNIGMDNLLDEAATVVANATAVALKSEAKLQFFINTLTKLDQKLVKDCNAHKRDAEDAACSLKCSSSTVGLSDSSCHPPPASCE